MRDDEIMFLQYMGGMNPGETFWRQRPDLKEKWDREHATENKEADNEKR